MKFGQVRGTLAAVCGILLAGLLTGGCSTTQGSSKQKFADLPPEEGQPQPAQAAQTAPPPPVAVGTSSGNAVAATSPNTAVTPTGGTVEPAGAETHVANAKSSSSDTAPPRDYSQYRLRVGDSLSVSYSDTPQPILPADPKVNDDGKITLMLNQTFDAAGKSCSMLADEIRARYVPRYYVNMTVTVVHMIQTQFFYVRGEVKAPARQVYTGPITVNQAIAACGDFTEFAKKTNVDLIRVDGRKQKVDCLKAIKSPALDPQVYPGDTIVVHRKIF